MSLNSKASGGGSSNSSCFSGSGSSCFYSGKSIALEVVIFGNRSSCSNFGSFSSSSSSTVVVVKVVGVVLVAVKEPVALVRAAVVIVYNECGDSRSSTHLISSK